ATLEKKALPDKKSRRRAAVDKAPRPPVESAVLPADGTVESTLSPRPVRVKLLDGSTVVGTVHAEEALSLVVDCTPGQLSIPRNRISTVSYDAAAGVGQKRAPVQQLDDEDKPTRKRAAQP